MVGLGEPGRENATCYGTNLAAEAEFRRWACWPSISLCRQLRSTIKELRQNRQIDAYLVGVQRRQRS